jgi:hypothetical protein
MKIFKKAIALVLLFSVTIYANESHEHSHGCKHKSFDSNVAVQMEADKTMIEKNAKQKVQKLVLAKKIPQSWKNAEISKIEKTKNDTNDWAVSFNNTKIKNRSKQTLYIFVSPYGKVMGANYTGK